ncbi:MULTISPECIES: NapC/NirT family cytochrome c [Vibrio]|uniref:Cytochrome c-type protein n=1 Tax=Vibrio ostreae TaxID=2841925 RepID=A0A975YPJ4_9VIBR|nr:MULTISPECIES: NapC/NirT family cytochrome c [Vibrio]QXO18600.1 NapC/NirT family cytochrome c [Vibrio ostreae]
MNWWKKPNSKWLLGIPLGGMLAFILGALSLGAYHGVMDYTNNNAFCFSCHIGMDTIVEEYQQSVHFNNTKGVIAATCADCHVPRELIPKLIVKITASADVIHKLTGDIRLDNFETEHRPRLAKHVTQQFIDNKSKQCRYCHQIERMELENQARTTARRHQMMEERGQSCIDCHAGIAHKLPQSEQSSQPAQSENTQDESSEPSSRAVNP